MTAELDCRTLFIMGVHAIQARQIMEETRRVLRASQESFRSAQMRLVQSQVNLRVCEELLTSRTLLLNWRNADEATRKP